MYTGFCILSILWNQKEENIDVHVYCIYIYVFFFLFPENTKNTEPSIHIHLCFLLSVSRKCWEYRTQYTCTSMFTGFCILCILWKQKEENIDVYVYWVLYSQYSLETERRKHRCTCIQMLRIQNPVYFYIYVFFFLFPENTENTEPRILLHQCFLSSVSSEYWEFVFLVCTGNRNKKT
jgi:hypothetical protein